MYTTESMCSSEFMHQLICSLFVYFFSFYAVYALGIFQLNTNLSTLVLSKHSLYKRRNEDMFVLKSCSSGLLLQYAKT